MRADESQAMAKAIETEGLVPHSEAIQEQRKESQGEAERNSERRVGVKSGPKHSSVHAARGGGRHRHQTSCRTGARRVVVHDPKGAGFAQQ